MKDKVLKTAEINRRIHLSYDTSYRTNTSWLKDMCDYGFLEKLNHGEYRICLMNDEYLPVEGGSVPVFPPNLEEEVVFPDFSGNELL